MSLPSLDEVDYGTGKAAEKVVMGGAGSYAAIGARLAAGQRFAGLVSWIVDVGSDFPPEFRLTIEAWQTNCIFREDRARLTTRAWNGYSGEDGHRGRTPWTLDLPAGAVRLTQRVSLRVPDSEDTP